MKTLRLNQADLRLDLLSKGCGESTASSNSSSGCSSMSTGAPLPAAACPARASVQQQQQQQQVRHAARCAPGDETRHKTTAVQQPPTMPARDGQQQQIVQRRDSAAASTLSEAARFNAAHKTHSSPVGGSAARNPASGHQQQPPAASKRNSGGAQAAGSGGTPLYAASWRQHSAGGARPVALERHQQQQQQQQQQHRQQQQRPRRASVAVADGSARGRGAGKQQAPAAGSMLVMGRKQSSGNFMLMQTATAAAGGSMFASNHSFGAEPSDQNQSFQPQQQPMPMLMHNSNNDHHHHQQQPQQPYQFIMGQPSTMITASSELAMNVVGPTQTPARRDSAAAAAGPTFGGALIPIPPDQIHLRRLSDQSNLVRRSSIITDTIDVVSMLHRNRSHSNIDTVSYAFYQPQFLAQQRQEQSLDYSDENLRDSYAQQQQQQQQRRRGSSIYGASPPDQVASKQQMTSIITSCSQKHRGRRRSSDDGMHTDSSSDLDDDVDGDADEDPRLAGQMNFGELDNEQPSEYFASPRGLEQQQQQHQLDCAGGYLVGQPAASQMVPSIPSVSVSEFSSSQQRLNQVSGGAGAGGQAAGGQPLMQLEQLMTSPIQINVAVEQAIQQQQQRQDLLRQYLPAVASNLQQQQQLPVGYSALAPRRGSSGRVLPKIPISDQSQSLLDLPLHSAPDTGGGGGGTTTSGPQFVSAGRNSLSNGSMNRLSGGADGAHQHQQYQQQGLNHSTLGLPSAGQTIRRASAPEGQNIKIVVDDMDGAMMRSNGSLMMMMMAAAAATSNGDQVAGAAQPAAPAPGGAPSASGQISNGGGPQRQLHYHRTHHYRHGGELYERLVLYRDDSLDPSTNMARGFGLQVMGGKIDEQGKLQASVVWILPGGPADKVGLKCGDKIIEWDGKCLVNMTYEQVADVIESSANIAELLVKPAHRLELQPGSASVVRSQRRLSHQTERDLKKMIQQQQQQQQQWHNQPQQQMSQQTAGGEKTSHLLEPASGNSSHHNHQQQQQAISAGNSPLRSGTGRKLPQIPGGGSGPFQAGGLSAPLQDSAKISQIKLTSSSTSHLEQQQQQQHQTTSTNSYYAVASSAEAHSSGLLLGQLQPEHRTLSAQNGTTSLSSGQQAAAQMLWYQQPQSQSSLYDQQQQPFGAYNLPTAAPPPLCHISSHAPLAANLSAPSQSEVFGLIGLQVNVDERASQLEISVLSAINLNLSPSQDYFVRLRILPESNRFKACKTLPRSDLNWKETFLFQNFPIDQINRMALEIGIWLHDEAPRLSTQLAQPICEALIPIQSARERNTDFWPLRQPPTSPQARRKSLNDLLEFHHRQQDERLLGAQLSAGYQNTGSNNLPSSWPVAQNNPETTTARPADHGQQSRQQSLSAQQRQQQYPSAYAGGEEGEAFVRGRSSSNRNLPDMSKLRAQPRRASDEVAGSSSQRLSTRLSPAASRRSISVINVGANSGSLSRPSSRLGSQSNLLKQQQRRDSALLQQQQQQHLSSSGDSPVMTANKYGSPNTSTGSAARQSESQPPAKQVSRQATAAAQGEGLTPAGRRSSLVGIHNMVGYASQKSSLSDATDQKVAASSTSTSPSTSKRPSVTAAAATPGQQRHTRHAAEPTTSQRASASSNSGQPSPITTPVSCRPGSGSRRGSAVDPQFGPSAKLERKGSFAMLTLRKLKRTMSLTKGGDQEAPDSNEASRRSSSECEADVGEDLGVTRRLLEHSVDCVGRLKLSFIMTKGQLEIDVISAQGLKYDVESSLGVYIKMYLRGRNKSNKRKTRLVQPWESPIFKQLIKYDGCLVDNKSLEVSLWQKQGGLKGKMPIGFTEVRLSELSLNQLQTSWYNLRPVDSMCSSSMED